MRSTIISTMCMSMVLMFAGSCNKIEENNVKDAKAITAEKHYGLPVRLVTDVK